MGIVVAHGGSGSTVEKHGKAVEECIAVGKRMLSAGASAIDIAEAVVVALEDEELFNAGTGSYMTLDGRYELDAIVMDDVGGVGAVACVTSVKNPVKLARRVMDTPHILLAGRGADEYARYCGFPTEIPASKKAEKRLSEVRQGIKDGSIPDWASPRWKPFLEEARTMMDQWGCDTVGCVVLDNNSRMAAASSTGGTSFKLPGRVGDTPLVGAGIYVGPAGAVVATGIGEEIMKRVVSWEVYRRLSEGMNPMEACKIVVESAGGHPGAEMGVIAVSPEGWGEACSRTMAFSVHEDGTGSQTLSMDKLSGERERN